MPCFALFTSLNKQRASHSQMMPKKRQTTVATTNFVVQASRMGSGGKKEIFSLRKEIESEKRRKIIR